MRKNEKGFTLIELLAIIVILAVIALIATPIILNVVSNSRKNAAADGAYNVVKAVELAYSQASMDINAPKSLYVSFSNGTPTVSETAGGTQLDIEINLSGSKPKEGIVEIDAQGKTSISNLKINDYTCNYGDGENATGETAKKWPQNEIRCE